MLTPDTIVAGKYKIVGSLEAGGMGEVYEAWQIDLSRPVAIKLMHSYVADHPVMLQRFRREAEALGSLGHPNIVQIIEFRNDPGEPAMLVMEKLEGRSLRKLLREGGVLEPPRAAFIALQILSALASAHRANIVHRDIKPSNVFILKTLAVRDFVKLLDFGIAKVSHPLTSSAPLTSLGEVLGTEPYMAPEQAAGQPVDGRTDLFAVGCVLFEAIAGQRPRTAASARAPGDGVAPCRKLRELVPSVDPGLADAVDRALAFEPAHRFPNAESMAAALAPFATAGEGASSVQAATAPPETEDPQEQVTVVSRRPAAASAAMAGALPPEEQVTVVSRRPAAVPGTVREGRPEPRSPGAPVGGTVVMEARPQVAASPPAEPTRISGVPDVGRRATAPTVISAVAPASPAMMHPHERAHPTAQMLAEPPAPGRPGSLGDPRQTPGFATPQQAVWPMAPRPKPRTGVSSWWLLLVIVPFVGVLAAVIAFLELAATGHREALEDKTMIAAARKASCVAPSACHGQVTVMGGATYWVCSPVAEMPYTPGAVVFFSSGSTRPGRFQGKVGDRFRIVDNDDQERNLEADDVLGVYCGP